MVMSRDASPQTGAVGGRLSPSHRCLGSFLSAPLMEFLVHVSTALQKPHLAAPVFPLAVICVLDTSFDFLK